MPLRLKSPSRRGQPPRAAGCRAAGPEHNSIVHAGASTAPSSMTAMRAASRAKYRAVSPRRTRRQAAPPPEEPSRRTPFSVAITTRGSRQRLEVLHQHADRVGDADVLRILAQRHETFRWRVVRARPCRRAGRGRCARSRGRRSPPPGSGDRTARRDRLGPVVLESDAMCAAGRGLLTTRGKVVGCA